MSMYINYERFFNKRRELKEYRRRRKRFNNKNIRKVTSKNKFKFCYATNLLLKRSVKRNSFLKHLMSKSFVRIEKSEKEIKVPSNFTLKSNFNEVMTFFDDFISSFFNLENDIVLDFSKCNECCISTFSLLEVIVEELLLTINEYNNYVRYNIKKRILAKGSSSEKVSKFLHVFKYVKIKDDCEYRHDEYLLLGLRKGKDRNYQENRKSVVATQVVEFLNKVHSTKTEFSLSPNGENALSQFLNEVLGNAEDHSLRGSQWYVNAIAFFDKKNSNIIELNLTILNIGDSMYEGFIDTKDKNIKMYQELVDKFENDKKKFSRKVKFNIESLFCFYLLQEGYSRLKYEDFSRGNGTMNFINAFMVLGGFGDKNESFRSELNIATGHTLISMDNRFKPIMIDNNVRALPLNKQKDVNLLPEMECVTFKEKYFPGTILECKIYISEEYIRENITSN